MTGWRATFGSTIIARGAPALAGELCVRRLPRPSIPFVMAEYKITCTREQLLAQASDPRLHRAATLARIANSLRFAQMAGRAPNDASETAANRQRASSFFYLTGLLYEALRFADRLGAQFKESPAFKEGFAKLLKDPRTRDLRDGVLNRLRNKAIYHHDDDVFEQGIPLIDAHEMVFVRADDRRPSAYSYELSDVAILRFALASDSPSDTFVGEVSAAMVQVADVAQRFAVCSDLLIRETLLALNWSWQISNAGDPAV